MQRLNYHRVAPLAMEGLLRSGLYVEQELEPKLRHLIDLRVSQINGCAFCCELHDREARRGGESPERLATLAAWRESRLFDARECAALELAETLTNLASTRRVPDDIYERVAGLFDEREVVALVLAITNINTWNRFGIAFESRPNPSYWPNLPGAIAQLEALKDQSAPA